MYDIFFGQTYHVLVFIKIGEFPSCRIFVGILFVVCVFLTKTIRKLKMENGQTNHYNYQKLYLDFIKMTKLIVIYKEKSVSFNRS